MPKYTFNHYDGRELHVGEEWMEFPSAAAAKAEALKGLRECAASDLEGGTIATTTFIEIFDDCRMLLDTVSFEEAIYIMGMPGLPK